MKFRKKPIVIEAKQWFKEGDHPQEVCNYFDTETGYKEFCIRTLEGDMALTAGDWIITGVKGECYPCKPDIFEETYEAA